MLKLIGAGLFFVKLVILNDLTGLCKGLKPMGRYSIS